MLIPFLISDSFYDSLSSLLHPPLNSRLPSPIMFCTINRRAHILLRQHGLLKRSSCASLQGRRGQPSPSPGPFFPQFPLQLCHQPGSRGQTASPLSTVKPAASTSLISKMHLERLLIGFHAHATASFCDNGVRLYQHEGDFIDSSILRVSLILI